MTPMKWKELTQEVQPSAEKMLEIRKVEAFPHCQGSGQVHRPGRRVHRQARLEMLLPTGIHVDYDMSMAIRVREGWTTFAAFLSFIPEAYQKAVLDDIEQELYKAGDYKDEDLKTLMRLLRKLADDPMTRNP